MIFETTHSNRLRYPTPVARSTNVVRLVPADDGGQRRLAWAVTTKPDARVRAYADSWGNTVQYFTIQEAHFELEITGRSRVETGPRPAPSGDVPWIAYGRASLGPLLDLALQTPLTDPGIARPEAASGQDAWAWIAGLIAGMPARLRYRKGATGVDTTAAEALARGEGVCQDFAHAALGLLRSHRIPARYVGGYQYLGPDVRHDPHAWIEVWHPTGAWVGFDPTSGALVDERYVRVALGRDYEDAAPVRGHVAFAAPPRAHGAPEAPEVHVAIIQVPSPDHPLGFAPHDPDTGIAPASQGSPRAGTGPYAETGRTPRGVSRPKDI